MQQGTWETEEKGEESRDKGRVGVWMWVDKMGMASLGESQS